MKLFIITLSCLALAANAVTYVPSSPRLRRDVSELFAEPKASYLPPPIPDVVGEKLPQEPIQKLAITEEPIAEVQPEETTLVASAEPEIQETAVLGENGYEYKTVRKTVFRSRRDVSHLKLNYLPPFESQQPSNEYLPPVSNKINEESQSSGENVAPVVEQQEEEKEAEIATEAPQLSNEYLPPHSVKESEEMSSETAQPSNEYLPPAKIEETAETVSEAEPAAKSSEEPSLTNDNENETPEATTVAAPEEEESTAEVVEAATEAIQSESAIFAEDGYHYKQPQEVPADLFIIEPEPTPASAAVTREYLPPMEAELADIEVEVEGPSDGESAVLAEDGYHYRVIKRRF